MKNPKTKQPRGFTLVELMIVVAIIGVLAAVGGIAYTKYIKDTKVGKLKQLAMELAAAQEQYKSRNSSYLDAGTYSSGDKKFEKLLGFSKQLPPGVTVETKAGGADDDCSSFCEGATPPDDQIWYAVKVTQDMDTDSTDDTTVVHHNGLNQPLVLYEYK